jgi:hypothetical protein
VVAHHHAGVNPETGLCARFAQHLQKSLAILIILENLLPVGLTGHHVIGRVPCPQEGSNKGGRRPVLGVHGTPGVGGSSSCFSSTGYAGLGSGGWPAGSFEE